MPDPYEFHFRDYDPDNGISQADIDDSAEKQAFSERFNNLIKGLGYAQKDVARLTGIPKATVNRWTSGQSWPSAKHIFLLGKVLRVDPRWLITGQGKKRPHDDSYEEDEQSVHLLGLFRSLDNHGKSHLIKTAGLLWDSLLFHRLYNRRTTDPEIESDD